MDGKVGDERRKHPRERVNIFSAVTYTWVVNIFRLGYKRDLELEDLFQPLDEHKSNIIGDELSSAWDNELERCNKRIDNTTNVPSLRRVLLRVYGTRIALYGLILLVMEVVVRVLQPFALAHFLRYFTEDKMSKTEAYLYATCIIFATAAYSFLANPYTMAISHTGMKIRIACCSLVYRKTLKLSKVAANETTIGEAVNLLSNDVSRFDTAFMPLHTFWIGPLQTIMSTYFMYQEVGVAAIYGIIVLLLFIPLQLWFGNVTSILRLRTAMKTDERVRSTNEIIKGIQAIKMYAWEYLFRDIIKKARKCEISVIRYTTYMKSIVTSFSMYISRLSLFVTILIHVVSGDIVSSDKVFMLIAFYANLQQTMTIYFPYGISQFAELSVSIERIQKFLMHSESASVQIVQADGSGYRNLAYFQDVGNNDELRIGIENEKVDESSVILKNVHAKWTDDIFNGINIDIKSGELVAIIGKVGVGKSSLLNVILKELPVTKGTIIIPDKIAYASQEPWLFSASVQQNVLFGRPMDHQKYQRVIEVCQLQRDFKLLPYGDKTIVGERGVSLSGGQRARINLARAVYSDAPLYLLDDPLSAVDSRVGKLLFEECIQGYLAGHTRILVTHQIQFLRYVDKIIVLEDGGVMATGTFDQLIQMRVDLGSLEHPTIHELKNETLSSNSNSRLSTVSLNSFSLINNEKHQKQREPEEVAETRTRGSVSGNIYLSYLKAGGNCWVISMISSIYVMAQLSASGADWFLAFWINSEKDYQIDTSNYTSNSTVIIKDQFGRMLSRNKCIFIFSLLIILTIIISTVRSFVFFEHCMRASKQLHDAMFGCIIRATMQFLNTNSSGRILNRFTKDMGTIDELLPNTLIECLQISLAALGIVVVVSITNPWLLIPTVIVSIALYIFRVIYVTTSRSVKRLEGVARSPMYSHFSATLQGLTTIRSFEAGAILIEEFDRHQDLHSSAWYLYIVSSRAFAFWLDCINVLYTIIVTYSFLLLPEDSDFRNGANVGLAITQSLGLTGDLQWGIRQSAELDNQMTSVERVKEYTSIGSEPPLESSPDKKPPNDWPQLARIEFKNVYLSYGTDTPPALKNLNFVIEPRERVGIVGRTGAGKSSLISALFRLVDVKGLIAIDGVDTGEIGLHDLRSKISIIPQEPFLFSGTLRKNLDPFGEYEDDVLWAALEDVRLKEMGLEICINEGGTNLSVGQRQLVCLARAIVKRNRILVLDEATANVDSRTDEFIQLTIRQKFSDCTLLTIAHRLNTVIDSDRILVIDAGRVVEFDHPHVLLQNEHGIFSKMVKETGSALAEMLAAKANYNKRGFSSTTL